MKYFLTIFFILRSLCGASAWPELEQVLVWSGNNRSELTAALEAMPGRDMEHLIRLLRSHG